jgi:hypothetical protein
MMIMIIIIYIYIYIYILLETCNFKISAPNFLFSLSKQVKKTVLFFVAL